MGQVINELFVILQILMAIGKSINDFCSPSGIMPEGFFFCLSLAPAEQRYRYLKYRDLLGSQIPPKDIPLNNGKYTKMNIKIYKSTNIILNEKEVNSMNENNEEGEDLLTAEQVAKDFFKGKFKYHFILRMTREGSLPAIKAGKRYLYRKSDLETWVKLNFSTPANAEIKLNENQNQKRGNHYD